MIKILIVEDERAISDLIKLNLKNAGYECTTAYDGLEAADILEDKTFDLILLDVMLPKINGFELMEYIRPLEIPVIFLTAMNSIDNKIKGLTSGAEDYIVKPFEVAELLARIQIVLRRYNKADTTLTFKNIIVNTETLTVTIDNTEVELTPKEFDLFVLLLRNKNITLYREKMYEEIWGGDYIGDSRTLDLHIQRLRKKLSLDQSLKTVYKIGYRLEE